jgi:hypothetical protein
MVPALAERHIVVALDPPGQGRTQVLDPSFGYDADAILRSIAGFFTRLGWSARRSWGTPGAAGSGCGSPSFTRPE